MKVLVIRFSSMGDVILTTPIVRMLSTQLHAEVHFLTKSTYQTLLKGNPYIEKVLIHSSISYNLMKDERYDLIVDLHNNLRSFGLKTYLSIKSISTKKNIIKKWMLLLFGTKSKKNLNVVENYLDSLTALGIMDDDLGLEFYNHTQFSKISFNRKKKLIAICMGGTYVTKRIPFNLIQPCFKLHGYEFILLGGNDIVSPEIKLDNVYNCIGELSISESASVLQQADLVISGDTGMMHLAAALQKELIVIWGSTSPQLGYYPYYGAQSNQKFMSISNDDISCRPCSKYGRDGCPMGHLNCLTQLSSTELVKEIELKLSP